MKNMKNKYISISLALFIGISLFVAYSYLRGGCLEDVSFAKSLIEQHLQRKGLSKEILVLDSLRTQDCTVSFIYENSDNHLYFSVIDGGKVTWWDTNERGPL